MIKLMELLSNKIQISVIPQYNGVNVIATKNNSEIGKLQIGWNNRGADTATIYAVDVEENLQRNGIGTALFKKVKPLLKRMGVKTLNGALEGSGMVQLLNKVFGPGNTKYFCGREISTEEAIHIMDVEYGRCIAKTTIK